MKLVLVLFMLSVGLPVFSQKVMERDTSYTVFSTFNKEIKKFPFIKIVIKQQYQEVDEVKDVVYKKAGSRELHIDAFYSKSKVANPAVIMIHGGGWKSGNKSHMEPMAIEIASKGYSCFAVEYRLSPEAKYPAAIFDVKSAIQFIKDNAAKFNVDTTRVAILGCSSGGQMAALVGTTNGNKSFEEGKSSHKSSANVQAVVDMDGILAFKHPESEEGKVAALWLGGSYEERTKIWNQASALYHVDENTPPILFVNSDMPRFHAGRDDMIAKLNELGIYSKIKNIHDSPHSFWFFHPWFEEMVESATDFLDKIFKTKIN
jgi:acetyl esterase/lipase